MSPLIGKSNYICNREWNKLNTSPKMLQTFYNILNEALSMDKFDNEKLFKKFPSKKYLKKIDPFKQLNITSKIDPEIYLRLQTTILKLTNRFWKMDEFINFLILWFIYAYKNPVRPPRLPFHRKYKRKRYDNLIKFNKVFHKYYKNILYSHDMK